MKKTIAAITLSLVCLLVMAGSFQTADAAGNVPQKVLDLRSSVVRVICQTSDGYSMGTGFAVGRDSPQYIVTNLHVVEKSTGSVWILRSDNQRVAATAYVQMPNADLCVLKLDVPLYDMKPVELCDKTPAKAGEAIYTLGFPGAADAFSDKTTGNPEDITITQGIVSAVKSVTLRQGGSPIKMVQIDAAISHGNSGGPLVNEQGQVLGVNSYGMADAENINGAVSILELIDTLDNNGIPRLSASAPENSGGQSPIYWIIGAVVLAAGGAAVIIRMLRRKKPSVKTASVSLDEYLRQWGGRLPYDTAIRVLENALRALAELHESGQSHLDVCPENIRISDNKAYLLPQASAGARKVLLRPGFSASEQYRADGRPGPWSDVYSVCAVLFAMVTGAKPAGILEREAAGGELSFGGANIGAEPAAVILSGLALDAAGRPQNCVALIHALGLPAQAPHKTMLSAAPSPLPAVKRVRKGRKALIAALAAVAVLCAGAVGFYMYNDQCYHEAVECVSQQDYAGAVGKLSHVLTAFKDSRKWMGFACAGSDMQSHRYDAARKEFKELGDFNGASAMIRESGYQEARYVLSRKGFDRARELFISLGDYKDSPQMVNEADYQKALDLMENKDFDGAKFGFTYLSGIGYKDSALMVLETDYRSAMEFLQDKLYDVAKNNFTVLAAQNYKDSEDMITECDYRRAVDLVNSGDPATAYALFQTLPGYKDSSSYLPKLGDSIYNQAISLYRNQQFPDARIAFRIVPDYKRSADYQTLLDGTDIFTFKNIQMPKDYLRSLAAKIKALGDFEDAQELSRRLDAWAK